MRKKLWDALHDIGRAKSAVGRVMQEENEKAVSSWTIFGRRYHAKRARDLYALYEVLARVDETIRAAKDAPTYGEVEFHDVLATCEYTGPR